MQDFLDQFNPVFAGIVVGLFVVPVLVLTWRIWLPLLLSFYRAFLMSIHEVQDTLEENKLDEK